MSRAIVNVATGQYTRGQARLVKFGGEIHLWDSIPNAGA